MKDNIQEREGIQGQLGRRGLRRYWEEINNAYRCLQAHCMMLQDLSFTIFLHTVS